MRELVQVFAQRYQAYARHGAGADECSGNDLAGQNNRRDRWNIGTVAIAGDDEPFARDRPPGFVATLQNDMHAAVGGAEAVEPIARFEQRRGMLGRVDWKSETHAPGQQPHAEMNGRNFHAGGKLYLLDAESFRQKIKIGNV